MTTQTINTTKGALQHIPVKQIRPHPDNPRRDLGDLTELTASIKENGVLQNLTVVPMVGNITGKPLEESYRCVVGHRRLAAAVMAGLETVPCVVADMTENQQRITMFTENMQRNDLTIWEQAHGLQTMIDLGDTVASLALKTGLSESTVRRRVRLTELDQKAFEKAEERGATLKDYIELEKILNLDLKNKVLAAIGTKNFEYELRNAIDHECKQMDRQTWEEFLDEFATPAEFSYGDHVTVKQFNLSDIPEDVMEMPEDVDSVQYFYELGRWGSGKLFRDKTESDQEQERQETPEEADRRSRVEQLKSLTSVAKQTRDAFIANYPQLQARKNVKHILGHLLENMVESNKSWIQCNDRIFAMVMGINLPEGGFDTSEDLIAPALDKSVERNLLALAWSTQSGNNDDYFTWRGAYKESRSLDWIYDFLEGLGYELSDEEQQLKDGTHPLYIQPEPRADAQAEEDEDFEEDDE
jgi:ParB family chromosome partitioning protein